MIRKLRLKFICVNMLIVTVMMGIIFGLVYHFTRTGLEAQSLTMLQSVAAEPLRHSRPGERLPQEVQLPFFVLDRDRDGTLTAVGGGYYDLSDQAFLQTLLDAAARDGAWVGVLHEYGLRYCRGVTPHGERIAFADMSSERATLQHLLKTCSVIAFLCFAAFLLISWLLARWAVRPVEKAWQQQRQFIADASHELKTPLTVIMTNAELLNSPDFDEAHRGQFAAHILTMSRQMRQLLEEMLTLARADSGRNTMVFSSVDLSHLVSDAVLPFEPIFFEKGLTLTTRAAGGIMVQGSTQHLRQTVDILLDNAQKYAVPPGEVTVELKDMGNRCRLAVSNPGPALSKAELTDIFKRFYRVDKAHTQRGSYGLGLSIAQSIVTQHHGRIWAESKNGRNTFWVELPIRPHGAKK